MSKEVEVQHGAPKEPLPLWRVKFDGMTEKETLVLEAEGYEEAVGTAKDLFPDVSNLSVTETDRHFPE